MDNNPLNCKELQNPKVNLKGYIFLLLGIVIFSGILSDAEGWVSIFDYTAMLGEFGTIANSSSSGFKGVGGMGAREGFAFALTLLPAVGLAMGLISVIEGQGGFAAAQRLLTPILKPVIGLPGACGLALIASFQVVDIGSSKAYHLRKEGLITIEELTIFSTFLFSAGQLISVYYSVGVVLFQYYPENIPIYVPLLVIFAVKIFGANLMRIYLQLERKISNYASKSEPHNR